MTGVQTCALPISKLQELVDKMLIGESTPEETQQALIKEINAILAG